MKKQSLNQSWRFRRGDPPHFAHGRVDDADWRPLDLPHDWSIELARDADNPSGVANGWFPMGRGWYTRDLAAPEAWRGKRVLVEFEGVYMNAEVWLDEHFVGRHPYGYTTFALDLTPYLNVGAQHTLRVRVENSAQTNSRWYSGSGIYRPVWLYVGGPLRIAHWGLAVATPQASAERAAVHVETRIENDTNVAQVVDLALAIYDGQGTIVASGTARGAVEGNGDRILRCDLEITAPGLWSPAAPHLYRLKAELQVDGLAVDGASTPFGIRSLAYSAQEGFVLNGEPTLLKGGCVHHDNGILGAASYPRSEARQVELLKASGFNAIRCAHNPPAPALLDACDRLGMLVIDEAFDCWRQGKNPFDYHTVFADWWQRDIESMVYRDRNHPSVIMWSIGNEVLERDGRSEGAWIARALADHVRALDPTRPVTAAICKLWDDRREWKDTDPVFAALDVGGYNYAWDLYASDHERRPERIMVGTESFPLKALENWQQVEAHNHVIGDFVWTSFDYLGESGIGRQYYEGENAGFLAEFPWHQAYCGDLDLCGFKRPQSYYRDMVWGAANQVYIAVHYPVPEDKTAAVTRWGWPDVAPNWTWPGREGQTFQVDVYSNCERVELFLDDASLGVQPTTRDDNLTASFQVPYQPGALRAVGYAGEETVAEMVLETVGLPAAIRLIPDRETIPAAPDSLCFVTVEVVDAQGRLQPNAANEIFVTTVGAGSVAAVGSGDPANTEPYRGNQHTVYRGRCLVALRSTGEAGQIRLRAQADGLEEAEIAIEAQ
jgi:beta-galactosidase